MPKHVLYLQAETVSHPAPPGWAAGGEQACLWACHPAPRNFQATQPPAATNLWAAW